MHHVYISLPCWICAKGGHLLAVGYVNVSSVCFAMSSRAKTVGPILGASDVPNEVSKA